MSFQTAHHRADIRRHTRRWTLLAVSACLAGCATTGAFRAGQHAEQAKDFDRAVVEYTKALKLNPQDQDVRLALDRVRLRAAQDHYFRGRRMAAAERVEEALVEFQLASELNPTDPEVDSALREARQRLRTKLAMTRPGQTELQALIERSRNLPPPGLDLPRDVKLPEAMVFSNASSRQVFTALSRFAGLSLVFDSTFREAPLTVDLRNATLEDALATLTASTRTFYRVTAPNTILIVPDTQAKRREYEESIVRTFYLSNADIKEVIDLLRVVVDVRQISPISAINAIALKDTPERLAAAERLINAIDKARPEVVIDVELLEVDRTRLREYGLQIASPGSAGISGSADVNRDNYTLQNLSTLSKSDVFLSGIPGVYYRLLKNDTNTRALANPELRTSEGLSAQARFGERVPVPMTQFAPIATGGVNQQPITSFNYENIGVNIDITPRTHHDDDVSLTLKLSVSSVSTATGFGGLPIFANREITTTIRLKDGETNMLAGLIRDDERTVLAGVPGLSDLPLVGRLFASHHKEAQETDIILTLTPHIVRVLDLTEADLRPFRLGRDSSAAIVELPAIQLPPRDREDAPGAPAGVQPAAPAFPQPLQPTLPETTTPLKPGEKPPVKKPGGRGGLP